MYLLLMAATVFLCCAAWLALVRAQAGAPTDSSQWMSDVYGLKYQRARSAHSPKFIIAAGSNGMFGIRSDRIERATGVPAVNMCVQAGLGLPYILHTARSVARPGDTVFLPLEYTLYSEQGYSDVLVDYVFAHDPGYSRSLPLLDQARLGLAVSVGRLIDGLRHRHRPAHGVGDVGVYRVGALDADGDEVANRAAAQTAQDRKALADQTPDQILLDPKPTAQAWADIARFAAWCRANHVTLLAGYPSTMDFPEYNRPYARRFLASVSDGYRRIGVPLLGTPDRSFFPTSDCYNTFYHLNSDAALRNTDYLTTLLRPYLKR